MAKKNYALAAKAARRFVAPDLAYQPRGPRRYNPPIALIGCGGIAEWHLKAYRKAGLNIVALCNRHPARATSLGKSYFPRAKIYADHREVLARPDIEVVDIATHVDVRPQMVEAALRAKKHVLSQKPFVLDLDQGRKLADLAEKMGVKLAVNQNGRWSPHFSYIRHAIAKGLIGEVMAVHLAVHWDHSWIAGSAFDEMRHIVLFDFGIHWFDILSAFMPDRPAKRVFASNAHAPGQIARPPLLAQATVEYDDAQASLTFNALTRFGTLDETAVIGTKGTLHSAGPDLGKQTVTLHTARGWARRKLRGSWFPDGFRGTMLELLQAIEEDREPANNARDNLRGLALCFAACRSADTAKPQLPGRVRTMSL